MPKKILYPCQYPGCQARYDETIAGTTDIPDAGQFEQSQASALLTGWIWPWDAEEAGDVGTHDHILNVLHKIKVDE